LEQIAAKAHSLAIPLYVAADNTTNPDDEISVENAVAQWRTAADATDDAVAQVIFLLVEEVSR
jgi:type I restriction enzyme M protein